MPVTNTNLTLGQRLGMGTNGGNLASGQQTEQPKERAEFWLNFGYATGNDKYPFVSLPKKGFNGGRDSNNGMALSMNDLLELRGSAEYKNLLAAQNELLEETIKLAEELEPGESVEFELQGFPIPGMALQLRRVEEQTTTEVAPDQNPLSLRQRMAQAAQAEAAAE